ncbi:T9SS type A sorting domain-containing protein [Antarcticibacterium sp. 1MA-6-2]|uniref:T9SS type A sorting domain-containing protein n=1 Tax=Antarcticibacterium sp. 1MA-6-2 TaxID=2908210 RepID=UPI001F2AFB3C|nr:T9SS type A sorting domain-containing protein [Antarcticibacterium sp. 1MA-6-2]UJH91475.1 T9SS type A sorting domain-containing protein [Antarcticibacterium sp. 1MA-6-2]
MLSWRLEHEEFLINVQPFQRNEKVPIFFSIAETTPVEILLAEKGNFEETIFLYDAEENLYYNISEPISLVLNKGDYAQRFYLTFETPLDPPQISPPSEIAIFQNNIEQRTEIRIQSNFNTEAIALFDISGRKLVEVKADPGKLEYLISTGNYSNGYYVIKIKSQDGAVISKKVIISN